MQETTLQLRVGVTRDRGFLFRTCVRPPASVTVGRGAGAMLRIDDPEMPERYTLFSVGHSACLLDFRPDWEVRVFRDDQPVTGQELIEEGIAFRRGDRTLLQMAPGTRGALRIGSVRLLFKWEEVGLSEVGEVPLQDVGAVPRCHACGLAMRDALAREGLYARCDSCRAINRFVDPEAEYRVIPPAGVGTRVDPADPLGPRVPDVSASQKVAALEEEADTMLGVPLFAPVTSLNTPVLPPGAQPAGLRGRINTPMDLRAARQPQRALEGMQTLFARSPFLGRRPAAAGRSSTPPPRGQAAPEQAAPERAAPEQAAPEQAAPEPSAAPAATTEPPPSPPPPARAPLPPRAPARLPQQHTALDAAALRAAVAGAQGGSSPPAEGGLLRADPGLWEVAEGAAEERGDAGLADAFYTAELEAMAPRLADDSVPWNTMSVLSARSALGAASGRLLGPDATPRRFLERNASLLVAAAGLSILTLGVLLLLSRPGDEPTPSASPPAVSASPALPLLGAQPPVSGQASLEAATYAKTLAGDLTPLSVRVEAFRLDRGEVTVARYLEFLRATRRSSPTAWSLHRPSKAHGAPVTGVSYPDARAYCRWAGGRLPTENEWERAASGREGRAYPWGDRMEPARVAAGEEVEAVGAHPKGATPEGIQDLIGNAVEWVKAPPGAEPFLKGGGAAPWNRPEYLTISARILPSAERWAPGPGFRCASS